MQHEQGSGAFENLGDRPRRQRTSLLAQTLVMRKSHHPIRAKRSAPRPSAPTEQPPLQIAAHLPQNQRALRLDAPQALKPLRMPPQNLRRARVTLHRHSKLSFLDQPPQRIRKTQQRIQPSEQSLHPQLLRHRLSRLLEQSLRPRRRFLDPFHRRGEAVESVVPGGGDVGPDASNGVRGVDEFGVVFVDEGLHGGVEGADVEGESFVRFEEGVDGGVGDVGEGVAGGVEGGGVEGVGRGGLGEGDLGGGFEFGGEGGGSGIGGDVLGMFALEGVILVLVVAVEIAVVVIVVVVVVVVGKLSYRFLVFFV
mmetsp:Transcript_11566/g.24383  ORF Transcript_11566/g.24383 Transcript_11566/m.24383 type:complete len:309 (+) Transcript_11566:2470-3396(+)